MLSGYCSYLALQEGQAVFSEGDQALCFYIILKGSCEVQMNQLDSFSRSSTSFSRASRGSGASSFGRASAEEDKVKREVGDTFGVASLVLGAPERQYSMVTCEKSVFLVVSQANFQPFMDVHPQLEPSIMMMTKRFLLRRYAKLHSSFFHAFTEDELERAALLATLWKISAGETVYNLGDAPRAFYVIAHGQVERDYLDGSPARPIPRGAYFGEMGLLLPRTPNLATVMATEDTTLLTISVDDWAVVVPPRNKSAEEKRFEELRSCVPLGYDAGRHRTPSWHSAQRAAEPARDLHFALQINLLLRLKREATPLDAVLVHPKACPALQDFAEERLRGAFRGTVFWPALKILQRVRIASAQHHLQTETELAVVEFLMEQMEQLVRLLIACPCPPPDTLLFEDGAQQTEPLGGGHLDYLDTMRLKRAVEALHAMERDLVDRVRRKALKAEHLEEALNRLCSEHHALLQLAFANFVDGSEHFTEVMDIVGPFDEDVAKRVDERDVSEIIDKVRAITPTGVIRPVIEARPQSEPAPPADDMLAAMMSAAADAARRQSFAGLGWKA